MVRRNKTQRFFCYLFLYGAGGKRIWALPSFYIVYSIRQIE